VQICLFLITISIVSFGSFVFFASPTAGDSWLPLLLLVYINILFNLKYISDIARNVLLGLTVITLAAFDNNSILIETILTIFTFYYCMKNNLNPGGWLF
jgi:hypothetical protein